MAFPTKIVTCCYCGARAALVMTKHGRHELTCAQCAAPLHDLKMLPVAKQVSKPAAKRGPKKIERELIRPSSIRTAKKVKRRDTDKYSRKRRKSKRGFKFFKEMLEEIVDFVEDIFD